MYNEVIKIKDHVLVIDEIDKQLKLLENISKPTHEKKINEEIKLNVP